MNVTYNNEFAAKRYYAPRNTYSKSTAKRICDFLFIILSIIAEVISNETVIMVSKVIVSLSCLVGLISVVHFVEVGVLGILSSVLIGLALLFIVGMTFRGED